MIRPKNKSLFYSSFTIHHCAHRFGWCFIVSAFFFQFHICMHKSFVIHHIIFSSLCKSMDGSHTIVQKNCEMMPVKGCSCPFDFYCLANHSRDTQNWMEAFKQSEYINNIVWCNLKKIIFIISEWGKWIVYTFAVYQ